MTRYGLFDLIEPMAPDHLPHLGAPLHMGGDVAIVNVHTEQGIGGQNDDVQVEEDDDDGNVISSGDAESDMLAEEGSDGEP